MNKFIKTLGLMAAMAVFMVGCTSEVPVGKLGKIVSPSGVQPELYQTGRPSVMGRDKLVLIEAASTFVPAKVAVIMTDRVKDKKGKISTRIGLTMDFVVNVRYRINPDNTVITAMMKDMTLDNLTTITASQVYRKYGNMVVGRVSREVLGKYTPEEVLSNLDEINKKLYGALKKGISGSPIIISEASLGPITLPEVISDRISKNKEVELSEAEKRADQKIAMLEKANQLALANQQAAIDLVDAGSLAAQNGVLKRSITPEVLELRRMEIQKLQIEMFKGLAAKGNNNTIVLPYEALSSSGAQMKMYNNK